MVKAGIIAGFVALGTYVLYQKSETVRNFLCCLCRNTFAKISPINPHGTSEAAAAGGCCGSSASATSCSPAQKAECAAKGCSAEKQAACAAKSACCKGGDIEDAGCCQNKEAYPIAHNKGSKPIAVDLTGTLALKFAIISCIRP